MPIDARARPTRRRDRAPAPRAAQDRERAQPVGKPRRLLEPSNPKPSRRPRERLPRRDEVRRDEERAGVVARAPSVTIGAR